MKFSFGIVVILVSFWGYSQTKWMDLTGKQKAFFYNVSRNVPNLKMEFLHLFEFTDSIPYINDTLPDYPYVEKAVVEDSLILLAHQTEFRRKNNGLISDLATHYALWELDLVLQFRNSTKPKFAYLKPKLKQFERYIIEKAPASAVKTLSDGTYELATSISRYYAPNLTINEKIAAIKNSGLAENDQLLIIRAVYYAQEKYVKNRSFEIIKLLEGDQSSEYINFLIAAGDGDNWSDLESVYRAKYSRALPDPKGLFNFDTQLSKDEKTKEPILKTLSNPTKSLITNPVKPTQIHVDVWGYHPERQTTIVIQKGGNSYILYGNNDNRFVSPDSTFEGGSTYWRLIYELEQIHIADLKERIYGKKGYDYWIAEYEERIEVTRLKIKETEQALNAIRYEPTGQPKMKKKKIKKKDLGKSDQDNQGHPTGKPTGTAKKKQVLRNRLIALNTQLENEIRTRDELIKEKEEAFDLLASYETLLDKMMKNVGHTYVEFESDKKGNYIFDDGSTFNYFNQNFTFYPNGQSDNFDIITIAFGEKVFSKTIEEVFVHLNVSYPTLNSKYTLRKTVTPEKTTQNLSVSDSIQIRELFWALGNTNKKIELKTFGGGIMGQTGEVYFRDSTGSPTPFDKDRQVVSAVYVYRADIAQSIQMNLTAYKNNMIPMNFNDKFQSYYVKAKAKNPALNEIDFYTALLAKKRMDIWLEQLNNLANLWLKDLDYQPTVLKKLAKLKNKNHFALINSEIKVKLPKK